MKSVRLATMLVSLGVTSSVAHAQAFDITSTNFNFDPTILQLPWTCKTGTGQACTTDQLSQPSLYRQVLILPTGYTQDEYSKFFADADRLRVSASDPPGELVWSEQHRDHILYITYWIAGGDLPTSSTASTATFGAAVAVHPIRGYELSVSNQRVYDLVDQLRVTQKWSPIATVVIGDTDLTPVTKNSVEPSFTRRSYGIAKLTRSDLESGYIASHELAHASLSFVDEYVEQGLENLNIRSLDVATPLLLFDYTWGGFVTAVGNLFGVYDYNVSEILANNGADNVSTSRYPSTVYSGLPRDTYQYEGGMFFGRGTFHQAGKNLMNSDAYNPAPDNGFAYAHSPAQQRDIDTAFSGTTHRANDRIRNAGPMTTWFAMYGGETTVLMFDADKNHRWHPTQQYQVRVGWWERVWFTSYWYGIPYPNYQDVWKTATKTVYPQALSVDLKASALYGMANLTQNVLCGIGVQAPKPDGTTFDLCSTPLSDIASAFLPTFKFYVPYQPTTVPATQWFTTYYWQFATFNGTYWSGYTPWASFYRSL